MNSLAQQKKNNSQEGHILKILQEEKKGEDNLRTEKITRLEPILSIGESFRKAREKQNLSLENISKHLRISVRYLDAIETQNLKNLPERVYILGFVRSYASYLGLDVSHALIEFKRQVLEELNTPDLVLPGNPLKRHTIPSVYVVFLPLLVCLLVVLGWFFLRSSHDLSSSQLSNTPVHSEKREL